MADGLNIKIVGDRELIARFGAMPKALHDALLKKISVLALLLEAKVKGKLSNDVLNVKTGTLRASIFSEVTDTATSVTGRAASGGSISYAAVHEFGGKIDIPEIIPTKAQALHFVMDGRDVFVKRVAAHTVTMPERSYMRSSLTDMKQQIIDEMRQAVVDAVRK